MPRHAQANHKLLTSKDLSTLRNKPSKHKPTASSNEQSSAKNPFQLKRVMLIASQRRDHGQRQALVISQKQNIDGENKLATLIV